MKSSYALVRTGEGRTGSSSSTATASPSSCSRPGSILSGLTVDEMKSAPPLEGPLGGIGREPPRVDLRASVAMGNSVLTDRPGRRGATLARISHQGVSPG